MMVKNVHFTFEEVIKEIDHLEADDLMGWLQTICKFYLNDQDLIVLDALKAKHAGEYKQRELSVLFCMSQPFLSVKFKHIRIKILTLYNFLRCDTMIEEYFAAKRDLTPRQYAFLQLVMAGNSFYDIAKVERVSNPDVSITFKFMLQRLDKTGRYPYLIKFLHKYKGKFVKN